MSNIALKCQKCGQSVALWDSFCFRCGNWLAVNVNSFWPPDTVNIHRKGIHDFVDLETLKYFNMPNPVEKTETVVFLLNHILILGKQEAVMLKPNSSEVWKRFSFRAGKPYQAGYLRPYLLVSTKSDLEVIHLNQEGNKKVFRDMEGLCTYPAILDNPTTKRAVFGHNEGIVICDLSPEIFETKPKGDLYHIPLAFEERETLSPPIQHGRIIYFLSSRGRLLRVDTYNAMPGERESFRLEGEVKPEGTLISQPAIYAGWMIFEEVTFGADRSVTVNIMGFDLSSREYKPMQLISETASGLEREILFLYEARRNSPPIADRQRGIFFSSPDLKKLYSCSFDNKGNLKTNHTIRSTHAPLTHWNCLCFSNGTTLSISPHSGTVEALTPNGHDGSGKTLFAIPDNERTNDFSRPIYMPSKEGGAIYLVTRKQIHIFKEQMHIFKEKGTT